MVPTGRLPPASSEALTLARGGLAASGRSATVALLQHCLRPAYTQSATRRLRRLRGVPQLPVATARRVQTHRLLALCLLRPDIAPRDVLTPVQHRPQLAELAFVGGREGLAEGEGELNPEAPRMVQREFVRVPHGGQREEIGADLGGRV